MKIVVLAYLLTTAALFAGGDVRTTKEVFRGADRAAMVTAPDKVELCVLRAVFESPRHMQPKEYVETEFKRVASKSVAVLKEALVTDDAYWWDTTVGCLPVWNARIKFFKGEHVLSADICFHCDLMQLSFDGVHYSGGLFVHPPEKIFAIVKDAFPEEEVVRAIAKSYAQKKD